MLEPGSLEQFATDLERRTFPKPTLLNKIKSTLLDKIKQTTLEFILLKLLKARKQDLLESILMEQNFRVPLNSLNSTEKAIKEMQAKQDGALENLEEHVRKELGDMKAQLREVREQIAMIAHKLSQ